MPEMQLSGVSPEDIRLRSYLIWEREGRPLGRDVDHWLRAEAELVEEAGRTAVMKAASAAEPKRARGGASARSPARAGRKAKS